MEKSRQLFSPRLVFLLTLALLMVATFQLAVQARDLGVLFVSSRWTAAVSLGILGCLVALVLLGTTWTSWWGKLEFATEVGMNGLARLNTVNLILFCLPVALFAYLVLGPRGDYLENLALRLPLFWLVVLAGTPFLRALGLSHSNLAYARSAIPWAQALGISWLLNGLGYKIATFFSDVSTYPFSLGWSETSRYYFASLYFSESIYGLSVAPTPLHPSRYLLQAIPFLVPGLPLWFHRLWQVVLWLGITSIAAYLLYKRLTRPQGWTIIAALAYGAWAFLFLIQGPVYYHLLVSVVIVLWGFDSRRFWKSLVVVVLASSWAGISRVNWFPIPGLLAAILYFLETKFDPVYLAMVIKWRLPWKAMWVYFFPPMVWVLIGTCMALTSQALYILLTSAWVGSFTSSFTSDLLWYRLLPNPTFPLGILPAILLVSLPLLIASINMLHGLHPLRLLVIGAILLAVFTAGLIVSVKIGGGSNLHNLDAFLVILLIVGSYAFFGSVQPDRQIGQENLALRTPRASISLVVLIPVLFAINSGSPQDLQSPNKAKEVLAQLKQLVDEVVHKEGEVLFISQRHLLTFGILPGIPLIGEYEKVFLMEMAMANNVAYLTDFYKDLRDQRYALIVSDQEKEVFKGSDEMFGEENDVWVARVTQPLLEYYQEAEIFKRFGIEVLVPKR